MSSTTYAPNGTTTAPTASTATTTHTTSTLTNTTTSTIANTTITQAPAITYIDTMTGMERSSTEAILPSATKTEKFLLTAADQESGSRDERLNRVIRTKYEAGLLKPYNYVKGYARLSRWMDSKWVYERYLLSLTSLAFSFFSCFGSVSQESKQQILQPLSVLRPKFRVRKPCATIIHSWQTSLFLLGCCSIITRLGIVSPPPSTLHPRCKQFILGPRVYWGSVRTHASWLWSCLFRNGCTSVSLATNRRDIQRQQGV